MHRKLWKSSWSGPPTQVTTLHLESYPQMYFHSLKLALLECLQHSCELMWQNLFKLRASGRFKACWSPFCLEGIGIPACPIFFSTLHILIKQYHQFDKVGENSLTMKNRMPLGTLLAMLQALIKKLKHSTHPLKEEMVCCLLELYEPEEDVSEHESEDWIRIIDKGSLAHIGNMTFGVCASMELEIRRYFSTASSSLGETRTELQVKITSNDDVKFLWSLVSAGWEEEEGQALLEQIVDLYVTVSGFSFASGWMEKYKQAQKMSTQKSKGIRKQLL